jgi:flagellar hook-length control protein FliK
MTSSIVEPLLKATAPPANAARDAGAGDPSFRDLIARSPGAASEPPDEPTTASPSPAASANQEAEELNRQRDENESDLHASDIVAEGAAQPQQIAEATKAKDDSLDERDIQADELAASNSPAREVPSSSTSNDSTARTAEPIDGAIVSEKQAALPALESAASGHEAPENLVGGSKLIEPEEVAIESVVSAGEEFIVASESKERGENKGASPVKLVERENASSPPVPPKGTVGDLPGAAEFTVDAPQGHKKSAKAVSEKREAKPNGSRATGPAESPASEATPAKTEAKLSSPTLAPVIDVPTVSGAAETATTRGETTQLPIAPGATATTSERLGALLTQHRGKPTKDHSAGALSESQQARLVQRVARAFDTARMRGEAEIRLRLSPPELGSLKLEVRMESGVMTARLEVETVAAQQALTDNLGTLRQRLAEQNIRVEQFSVDLTERDQGNSSNPQHSPFAQEERRAAQRSAGSSSQGNKSSTTSGNITEARPASTSNGRLDVLI